MPGGDFPYRHSLKHQLILLLTAFPSSDEQEAGLVGGSPSPDTIQALTPPANGIPGLQSPDDSPEVKGRHLEAMPRPVLACLLSPVSCFIIHMRVQGLVLSRAPHLILTLLLSETSISIPYFPVSPPYPPPYRGGIPSLVHTWPLMVAVLCLLCAATLSHIIVD